MLAGKTVVFFSAVPWSGIHARPQHFTTHFAKLGANVIFVEPAASVLAPFKQRDIPKLSRMRKVSSNIAVLTPPLLLPAGYGLMVINRLNQVLLWRTVSKVAQQLGWSVDIVWTHLPGSADLPTSLPIVYDCVDDHVAFSDLSHLWRRSVVGELEERLLQRAWRVVASSQLLLEKCSTLRTDAVLVGNGAEIGHFSDASHGYSNTLTLGHPIIGFYGGIGPWIDLEMIRKAAIIRPDLNFVMIGPVDSAVKPPSLPNIYFMGLIPYQSLPKYLADFDVALIPFKNNGVTQSVNPLKLYEYFAAGKPVVVTDIPELTRWKPLVYVASTSEELVNAIEKSLREPSSLKVDRQRSAEKNSWDSKMLDILQLLGGKNA